MAQERPITDTDFAFLMDAQPVKGAAYTPKGGFAPAGKKAKFFMMINHPDVKNREGGPAKSFTVMFDYPIMDHILQVIHYIAELPFDPEAPVISMEVPLKYPKKGEGPKFSGVSLRVGRDKSGRVFMSWTSKQIPKVGFVFKSPELAGLTIEGADIDVAIDSKLAALRIVEHYKARVIEWKRDIIVIEAPGGGDSGGGGGYNKPAGGGYNKPSAGGYDGGGDADGGDAGFDDDIPF
jgi:hypothetical protein